MLADADRSELYENLREWLGERPATLFMTTISPHDPDEVATKAFVRSEFDTFYRKMFWTNVGTMIALLALVLTAQAVG
jgi:hypothetical protein